MSEIAIIIPCYNEEKRLATHKIKQLFAESNLQIYFANDGSTDQTTQVVSDLVAQFPDRCHLIDHSVNQGKATTIYQAINQLNALDRYAYIGYFDADFSTPVEEIIRLTHLVEANKAEFVFGSRVLLLNSGIQRKYYRHIIGRTILTLLNFKFKLAIYDTQCGAKFFSADYIRHAFNAPFYTSWLFDVEVFIRLKRLDLLKNGLEVPISNWRDVEGSKLGWHSLLKIAKEMVLLLKHY